MLITKQHGRTLNKEWVLNELEEIRMESDRREILRYIGTTHVFDSFGETKEI
jgi:hypothetical protein